jgi:transposase
MSLCVLHQAGESVLHRQMKAAPEPFLKAITPYREDLVVSVECLFTWDWLADLWAREGMPFVLGHALYRRAIHGGKAKHDQIDAHKIALWLRGGMPPQADVYPAAMRATRDLLRRRMHRMRQRAELLAPIQQTNRPYTLPEFGKKLAYKANRQGVAEGFPAPAVQQSIAVDRALIDHSDRLLSAWELDMVNTATQQDANTCYRLRSVPGIGKSLSLVRLDEMHDIHRFPRGQAFVADCRLVKCAKASAGKRYGTSGTKIGNADLTWAFSEAAVLCLRDHPMGQQYLARLETHHGKSKALTVLAHTLARAVYDMGKRDTAVDMRTFLKASWSGVGEPVASLDDSGRSRRMALCHACLAASVNA